MVVSSIELTEVKLIARARAPKSEIVSVEGVEAWNGSVVSLSNYDFTTFPVSSLYSSVLVLLDVTVEANLVGDVGSLNLPRVASGEPVVGLLHLVAIYDSLLEDTVVVPDTIAPGRDFKSGQRI